MGNDNKDKTVTSNEKGIEFDYQRLAEAIVQANKEVTHKKQYTLNRRISIKIIGFLNGTLYAAGYCFCVSLMINIWMDRASSITKDLPLVSSILYTIILGIAVFALFVMQQDTFDDNAAEVYERFKTSLDLLAVVIALIALMILK